VVKSAGAGRQRRRFVAACAVQAIRLVRGPRGVENQTGAGAPKPKLKTGATGIEDQRTAGLQYGPGRKNVRGHACRRWPAFSSPSILAGLCRVKQFKPIVRNAAIGFDLIQVYRGTRFGATRTLETQEQKRKTRAKVRWATSGNRSHIVEASHSR